MPRAIVDVTFLAELGARAELAARMGEPTFSLPELAPIARLVRGDARVPELHARAQRWSATNGGYHELVRLAASYVEALDRALPPAAAVYVPKAAGELEPMLALWPHVLVIPLALALSARDLIRLRAHPVHVLGVVTCTTWGDGRPCSPAEFFYHDLDHARFKLREDLAVQGVDLPDAYQHGTTIDPQTGRHRLIVPAALGRVGPWLGQRTDVRAALASRLLGVIDSLPDRALAAAAELLLFEVVHEKSLPLEASVLRRELAAAAHLDKLRRKQASGFFGPHAPAAPVMAALDLGRRQLLEAL